MGDIAQHFNRSEFACKCGCGQDTVDVELVELLDELRYVFNKPITINSANRCPVHNANVGGSPNSQHLTGKAADIVVSDTNTSVVYMYLDREYPDDYGIGLYDTFVHVDTRSNKARWQT